MVGTDVYIIYTDIRPTDTDLMELLDVSDQPGLGEEDLAAVVTDRQTVTHLMELLDVSDQSSLGEEDLATVVTDTQTTDLQTLT